MGLLIVGIVIFLILSASPSSGFASFLLGILTLVTAFIYLIGLI